MADHKAELIDTTISLIRSAIEQFAANPSTKKERRDMFSVESTKRGAAIKTISLVGKIPLGEKTVEKRLTVTVDCEHNMMLLLITNYFVQHARALVSMASRGEPVSEFFDQFGDFLDAKLGAITKYCNNGDARRAGTPMVARGGGAAAATKKRKPAAAAKKPKKAPAAAKR